MTLTHHLKRITTSVLTTTFCLILLGYLATAGAQQLAPVQAKAKGPASVQKTLETLNSFLNLNDVQQKDLEEKQAQLEKEPPGAERTALEKELEQLKEEIRATRENFREISAGIDISALDDSDQPEFNLREELQALLKPAFEEMREATAHVRQRTALKENIARLQEQLSIIDSAIEHIERLKEANDDPELEKALDKALESWQKQRNFRESELQAAQVQLNKLVASETSLTISTERYLKRFFKKRGLYLFEALLSVIFVFVLSRLSYLLIKKLVPGFKARRRSFHIRLIELTHLLATIFFMVLAPMLVFYIVEDWVFFSLGILALFGLMWTLLRALPLLWRQINLFLNIGAVREGERVDYQGLPWLVKKINLYCDLYNPAANLSMRLPINNLLDLISRPFDHTEPWFPCKKGDWVILSDGMRGKVTGISPEMVQLVERGGTRVTYPMSDFLGLNPRNLATNFRIKETLGISYALQLQSTEKIPETLREYIMRRAADEGYANKLLDLKVEFEEAGNSSLDIVVIADFKGELGDIYNRLRRTLQRWCVDACTENGWEIPFPQLTIHGEVAAKA